MLFCLSFSKGSGTTEDSVTGTASGVLTAYYMKYIKECEEVNLLIEQGNEIHKEGYVRGYGKHIENKIIVQISGTAVRGDSFEIQ